MLMTPRHKGQDADGF